MILEQIQIGSFAVFTYVLGCEETRRGLVIDPAGDVDAILASAARHGLTIEKVINTHSHLDHVVGNAEFAERTGARIEIHEKDADSLGGVFQSIMGMFLGASRSPPADVRLRHGDAVRFGKESLEVIHTPGHTSGSICLLADGNVFTGDTLFVGAVGRTDLPGGSWRTLVESVRGRLCQLPDSTIVWPGHNYGTRPTSTIGQEKRTNGFIRGDVE